MVWQCWSCGRLGDRNPTKNYCHRQGVVSLKGSVRCCLCMKHAGWDGFWNNGCAKCHRINGTPLDPLKAQITTFKSPFEQLKAQKEKETTGAGTQGKARVPNNPGGPSFPEPTGISVSKIAVFEFDGVLFRTPLRPTWWPFNGYETMMESLLAPTVPAEPENEWWNDDALEAAVAACADDDTLAVLVTYRADFFEARIKKLLAARGVRFNEHRFRAVAPWLSRLGQTDRGESGFRSLSACFQNPAESREDKHTLSILADLVSRCSANPLQVHLWAAKERAAQLEFILKSTPEKLITVHAITSPPHAACSPTAEELERMVAAEKALQEAKVTQASNDVTLAPLPAWGGGPPSHLERQGMTPEGLPAREKSHSWAVRERMHRAQQARAQKYYAELKRLKEVEYQKKQAAIHRGKASKTPLSAVPEKQPTAPARPAQTAAAKAAPEAHWPADVYMADEGSSFPLLWRQVSGRSGSGENPLGEEEEEEPLSPSVRMYVYDREARAQGGEREEPEMEFRAYDEPEDDAMAEGALGWLMMYGGGDGGSEAGFSFVDGEDSDVRSIMSVESEGSAVLVGAGGGWSEASSWAGESEAWEVGSARSFAGSVEAAGGAGGLVGGGEEGSGKGGDDEGCVAEGRPVETRTPAPFLEAALRGRAATNPEGEGDGGSRRKSKSTERAPRQRSKEPGRTEEEEEAGWADREEERRGVKGARWSGRPRSPRQSPRRRSQERAGEGRGREETAAEESQVDQRLPLRWV